MAMLQKRLKAQREKEAEEKWQEECRKEEDWKKAEAT